MSKNDDARGIRPQQPKQKTDRRILRTRDRLGDALVELIQEKPFDSVTVQDVLDRACVARSTFYLHYSDKDDLFLSDVDEFLEAFATMLSRCEDRSDRVAPVREFFAHVAEGRKLYTALVESGKIHDFLESAQEHFARGIERRLSEMPRAAVGDLAPRHAIAHALAGAMLSLLTWWINRGMQTPPEQIDDIYHRMVWAGVGVSSGSASSTNLRE